MRRSPRIQQQKEKEKENTPPKSGSADSSKQGSPLSRKKPTTFTIIDKIVPKSPFKPAIGSPLRNHFKPDNSSPPSAIRKKALSVNIAKLASSSPSLSSSSFSLSSSPVLTCSSPLNSDDFDEVEQKLDIEIEMLEKLNLEFEQELEDLL